MKFESLNLFESLSESQREKVLVNSAEKSYGKSQIIFYEQEAANAFFMVLKGRVSVYKSQHDGTEMIIHSFETGDLFAEMPCFNDTTYPASAKAATDAEVLHLDCTAFKKAINDDPQISLRLISSLSKKITALEHYINTELKMSATQKTARYLLDNTEEFFAKKNKEIASELNMRVETFSRVMRKLKDMEAIDYDACSIDAGAIESLL